MKYGIAKLQLSIVAAGQVDKLIKYIDYQYRHGFARVSFCDVDIVFSPSVFVGTSTCSCRLIVP